MQTTEKKKAGRPRNQTERVVNTVGAGVTAEEKTLIQEAAIRAGYRGNLSAYLRAVILQAARA